MSYKMIKHILSLVPLVLISTLLGAIAHQIYMDLPIEQDTLSREVARIAIITVISFGYLIMSLIGIMIGLVIREEILDL